MKKKGSLVYGKVGELVYYGYIRVRWDRCSGNINVSRFRKEKRKICICIY